MMDGGKKISFGFSKSVKKSNLSNAIPQETKKVDYVECFDEKAIKVIGKEDKQDEPLVIPMLGTKTWHDRIVNRIDIDIYGDKTTKKDSAVKNKANAKPDHKTEVVNGDTPRILTLDELAAKEILADVNKSNIEDEQDTNLTVPTAQNPALDQVEETKPEHYELIPIEKYGEALLRGMGWSKEKGQNSNLKIPELRPKGMGLGAESAYLQKQKTSSRSKEEEQLKITKGCYIKILAGKHASSYGQVEGFDEDTARVFVKLSLTDETISVIDTLIKPVNKKEYDQNSKILNYRSYEEGQTREELRSERIKQNAKSSANVKVDSEDESRRRRKEKKYAKKNRESSPLSSNKLKSKYRSSSTDSESNSNDRKKNVKSDSEEEISRSKKSKYKRKHSSPDSDNHSSKKCKKKRDLSYSSDDDRKHKSKKSKHKRRESSSERLSHKNRKKDKERERRNTASNGKSKKCRKRSLS